ncbi:TetR family transcriptional regulator C-terminal domain-containing protein [Saccharopolyspora erythraea]|uniref:TetR/AcrR family transcriptional regulator n=1 Tax=Saccharopolyspora erythraea TaxID=1836 RepID=UPI001BA59422|nr:TetR family transcriptional regulator C-terminal domain-containing protein [Saccharopolyspora erythraea]QUH04634.1 TetR family transcriptional regulator C-terminal domain-containing protein [Saccharopolyspora erythraea]
MPKLVDHDQRRAELTRVVWQLIARDGIEGATVRKVAEEAGVSVGGLRHYFDSQRGLLRFAAQEMGKRVAARVADHLRAELPGQERAQRVLEELLPLDADRRREVDVWLAFLVRSRVDDSLAEMCRASWNGERHLCRIAVACCCGVRPPEAVGDQLPDPALEERSARLHVFMDGLTLQAAVFPGELAVERTRELVRDELAAIAAGAEGSGGSADFRGSAGTFGGSAETFGGSAGTFGGSAGSFS